jgi:hypothetical protein
MASATGSHPDTGSSVRPLPGSTTTIRPAAGRRFSAPKTALLTERGFGPEWATLRPPGPSRSEGDGRASDLPHPLSLSAANTARLAPSSDRTPTHISQWVTSAIDAHGIPEYRIPSRSTGLRS